MNASGADYAEYETKRADCGILARGAIVGFDADGLLTDKFSHAVSFGVKSTAPNLVGGDSWHLQAGPRPKAPRFVHEAQWAGGERPKLTKQQPDANLAQKQAAWDAARAAYTAALGAEKAHWDATTLVQHLAEEATYQAALEKARQTVDRIAYCGKCPVNIMGATVGQYLVPTAAAGDSIGVTLVAAGALTLAQSLIAVGRVRRILPDGRAEIVVKPI